MSFTLYTSFLFFCIFLRLEKSQQFVLDSLREKKNIPEIVDYHACLMIFRKQRVPTFHPCAHRKQPAFEPEPSPNWMLMRMLNIDVVFHISFHQQQGNRLESHFLVGQIGRTLYRLGCSSVWMECLLMPRRHNAKGKVLRALKWPVIKMYMTGTEISNIIAGNRVLLNS